MKLKRIGYNGEPLYIYKLRTMYPYSEFIQGDIYEKYHLDKSGKMKGIKAHNFEVLRDEEE